ncbi:MAG: class I SAM-dependent methyltransferase [Gemmatimonadaceae bacterium]
MKPSPDTERWKELDAASYDGVAEAFDRHSQRLSGKAAARLADLVQVGPRDRVLDVGTGTGLLPFSLAHAETPPASILGIDLSAGMIETARRRLRDELRNDPRVRFERMDAEQLQLPDASFDVVLSGFALTHVPRPELATREIFRVLTPGGRLGIALGSRPPAASRAQLRHAVAEIGRRIEVLRGRRLTADLLDRIVDRRIGRSVEVPEGAPLATRLNRVPLLRDLVRRAGFVDVDVSWRNYQNEIESAEEFWDLHRTIRSDSRKRLLVAPAGVENDVRQEFMDACRRTLARGGVMTFPISVVFVTARKPERAK